MPGTLCSLLPRLLYFDSIRGITSLLLILIGPDLAAQAVWIEGGGGMPSYALQYEQPLGRAIQGEGLHARIGLGVERARISAPLSIHWVTGGKPHHLVIMAGATPQVRDLDINDSDTFLFLVTGGGYRYESRRSPLMLSALVHPMLIMDPAPGNLIDRSPAFAVRLSAGFGLRL